MTDTEERIAKLQKLLDRVLTRGDSEPELEPDDGVGVTPPAGTLLPAAAAKESTKEKEEERDEEKDDAAWLADANGEKTQASEMRAAEPARGASPERAVPAAVAERAPDPPPSPPREEETRAPLESRSRLVAAADDKDDDVEELGDDDLVPASEGPETAMPLVRRSRLSTEVILSRDEVVVEEAVSDGRIQVNPDNVQIAQDSLMNDERRLADEIAAEEAHSSELEEATPISSRRPIANESIAQASESESESEEEAHSSPRHTPPPESGKQMAAPAVDSGAAGVRRSSLPPAAPGAAAGADVVRPEIAPSAHVASFSGVPATPRPATFGELIDAALEI